MLFDIVKFGILAALLAVIMNGLVQLLLYLDLNKRVYNHAPGQCSSVAGLEHGAADLALMSSGLALATAGLRFYNDSLAELKEAKGKVFVYNATGRTAWEATLDSKTLSHRNFNPHGLAVWEENGKVTVLVVNHRAKMDTVEVFRYKETQNDKKLAHLKTVKSPLFTNLAGVVAVAKDRFYATNYHYFKRPSLQTAELYMGLRLGSVLHFDGKNSSYAAQWIATPSGIALDKSKRYLYVSSLVSEKLIVYKIEADGQLSHFSNIPLSTSPGGIFVDPYTADLFVACHPVKSRLFRHETAPKTILSPSQVLRLHGRPAKGAWSVSQLYANDGATLSASSAVLKLKHHLVIGSLHDKLLSCDLDAPQLI